MPSEIVHKFPASLESFGFRKGTQDWGATLAIPKEDYVYAKPLGDKLNLFFIVALVPVESREQGLCFMAEQVEMPVISEAKEAVKIATTAELQEMFAQNGVPMSRNHIAVLARTGVIAKVNQGKYDLVKSVQGYVADLRRQSQGKGNADYQQERARRLAIQREEAELSLLSRKNQLMATESVKRGITEYVQAVKNKLLSASSRADNVEAQEIIDKCVRECLIDLSRIDPDKFGAQGSGKPMGSASKAKRKPVGRKGKSAKPKDKRGAGKVAKRKNSVSD